MIRIASTTLESILTSRPFASARESASSLRALIETPPRLRQGRNSVLDMVRQVVPPPNRNRRRRVSAKPKRTPLGPRLGRRGLRQRVRMATTAAPSTILKPPGSIAKLESEPNHALLWHEAGIYSASVSLFSIGGGLGCRGFFRDAKGALTWEMQLQPKQ